MRPSWDWTQLAFPLWSLCHVRIQEGGSLEEGPHQSSTMLVPWSSTSTLQKWEINVSHPVYGTVTVAWTGCGSLYWVPVLAACFPCLPASWNKPLGPVLIQVVLPGPLSSAQIKALWLLPSPVGYLVWGAFCAMPWGAKAGGAGRRDHHYCLVSKEASLLPAPQECPSHPQCGLRWNSITIRFLQQNDP